LGKGVAFHHAGLPTDVLEAIEEAVRQDRLGFLACTSSLTEGVNLPIRTVVIAETRYPGQDPDQQISGPRLVNALGRSGRAGRETEGWAVLVLAKKKEVTDFELLTPSQEDLNATSRLLTVGLEAAALLEAQLSANGEALFRETGATGDFLAFLWFAIASEENRGHEIEGVDLEGLLGSTLAFSQLPSDERATWLGIARKTLAIYGASPAEKRRTWSRIGTSIGSARLIDGLADRLAEEILSGEPPLLARPSEALAFLSASGALAELLRLPESPEWRFRTTRSGRSDAIAVDPLALLFAWVTGEHPDAMAQKFLQQVPDPGFRIEQLMDALTSNVEHYLSWSIGALVDLLNIRLEAASADQRICVLLGGFVRYGVEDPTALALMMGGLRSRLLARRIAQEVGDGLDLATARAALREWSVERLRVDLTATSSEMLDLLELTRMQRSSPLRRLLEEGTVRIPVEMGPQDPDTFVGELSLGEVPDDPEPRRIAVFGEGQILAHIPTRFLQDAGAILETGFELEVGLEVTEETSHVRLAMTVS
jgi:hypothetical protein